MGSRKKADDELPNGEWTGFYIQPDSVQRYGMDIVLEFDTDRISGTGSDPIGEYSINGVYDVKTTRCFWTKQYVEQHRVEYHGHVRQRAIVGQWDIPDQQNGWSGPFFLWPRALGDRETDFERLFLEFEWTDEFEPPEFDDFAP